MEILEAGVTLRDVITQEFLEIKNELKEQKEGLNKVVYIIYISLTSLSILNAIFNVIRTCRNSNKLILS